MNLMETASQIDLNFPLADGNFDVVLHDDYRHNLISAAREFLSSEIMIELSDHPVAQVLAHLVGADKLNIGEARTVLRCIEAMQAAVHEAAHFCAEYVCRRGEDYVPLGILHADMSEGHRMKYAMKHIHPVTLSERLFVLLAPQLFEVKPEIRFGSEVHIVGKNAYAFDEEEIRHLTGAGTDYFPFGSPTGYSEWAEALENAERIFLEHRAKLLTPICRAARLVLALPLDSTAHIPGADLEEVIRPLLIRGELHPEVNALPMRDEVRRLVSAGLDVGSGIDPTMFTRHYERHWGGSWQPMC